MFASVVTHSSIPLPSYVPILKLKAGSDVFAYESPYWTNTEVLNAGETGIDGSDDIDAKLEAFNTEPVSVLKLCYRSLTSGCYTYQLDREYASARALFSEEYVRSDNLGGGDLTAEEA
eukprot:UN23341